MRIVVTGADGFIGKQLCQRLAIDGHNVVCFGGDICTSLDVNYGIHKCDFVYHLAALSDVRMCETAPMKTILVNVLGTYLVAKRAMEVGASFVFTSSSAVYGDGLVPANEKQGCCPISVYGLSKVMAENAIRLLVDRGLRACIIRLGNVVGPTANTGVVPELFSKGMSDEVVDVFGDGKQRKGYMFIDDAVNALSMLLTVFRDKKFTIWNVGSVDWITLEELVECVIPGKSVRYVNEEGLEAKGWVGDVSWEWLSSLEFMKNGWRVSGNSLDAIKRSIVREKL